MRSAPLFLARSAMTCAGCPVVFSMYMFVSYPA